MNDTQLLRYSRHILLPQIDIEGQQALLNAKVLIVGAGGLGCPAAMYLASAGVGSLTLYDDDQVDLSNLQRQIAHHTDNIGTAKVISSQQTLKKLNPEINVIAVQARLQGETLQNEVLNTDVVLDCSDNFSTRFLLNRACVQHKTPLVSGAAIRFEGQVSVFDKRQIDSPCYNCLYQDNAEEQVNCATHGVVSPIVGIVGSIQAMEAIKLIIGMGDNLIGRLLVIDGLAMEFTSLRLRRNAQCGTCGEK